MFLVVDDESFNEAKCGTLTKLREHHFVSGHIYILLDVGTMKTVTGVIFSRDR